MARIGFPIQFRLILISILAHAIETRRFRMRSIVVSKIIFATAWLWFGGVLGGQDYAVQSEHVMYDPLFGMKYDPAKVRFENPPESLTQLCPFLRSRKDLRLYAAYGMAGAEIHLGSGLIEGVPGGPHPGPLTLDADGGDAVELRGGACLVSALGGF